MRQRRERDEAETPNTRVQLHRRLVVIKQRSFTQLSWSCTGEDFSVLESQFLLSSKTGSLRLRNELIFRSSLMFSSYHFDDISLIKCMYKWRICFLHWRISVCRHRQHELKSRFHTGNQQPKRNTLKVLYSVFLPKFLSSQQSANKVGHQAVQMMYS